MAYAAHADPYCYPGTTVLKNIPDLRHQDALDQFEARIYNFRAEMELPAGRFGAAHYRKVHHHLFQDVYSWAGRYRTVRIAKAGSMFCYPEHIAREMTALFGELRTKRYLRRLDTASFSHELAWFLASLNAIHPFREGNGRTQLLFAAALAAHASHPLNLEALEPKAWLAAMIASFQGNEQPLHEQILTPIAT